MPKISIIIPLYNAERYIAKTLESVLCQTYTDFEVIIVDDGSIDRGIEICQSFSDSRIKIIRQNNRGLAGARNTGIRHAQGDYIALLDSDDLWSPHKLDRHVAHLDQESDVGISFCYSEFVDESDKRMGLYQKSKRLRGITPDDILCRNPVGNGSSAIIRRTMLEAVQFQDNQYGLMEDCYFDESFRRAEDVEFWVRTCITTDWIIAGIPEVLTYYRITGGGLSADAVQQLRALDRVIEKTRTYAPEVIDRCESLARAYHFRYTARRLLTLGESKAALEMLHSALKSNWRILQEEPQKTLITTLAVYIMHYLPSWIYNPLKAFAMGAMTSHPNRKVSEGTSS